jgi:O-antigen/teichoic acid export membrane protein
MMNKNAIGKGVAYLYIEAITIMFSGYIFWLILSKITSPSVIGTSSAIISFISIFIGVSSVGVGGGIQRFLAKSLADKKIEDIKGFINSSIIIMSIGIVGSSVIILILRNWIYYSFKIDFGLVIISIIIMALTSIYYLLRAIIVPSLNTKIITTSSIFSVVIKLTVTTILVLFGTGVMGILVGYLIYPLISSIVLIITVKNTFYNHHDKINKNHTISLLYSTKDIFISSLGFWIPPTITTIGSQLGTILVMISSGANYAGIYFISFSLVSGISVIMSVLSTIAYPTISSLTDGRKRAVWRLIKISLVITLPLSHTIIVYSAEILQIFGSSYANGSLNLEILLLSILPTAITSGIGVLVYAYGNNRQLLIIGLFTSIPRALLYFIFVPIFGGNGAAITYLMGSIIGLIVSVIIANKIGLKLIWKQIISISIIPILLTIFLKYLGLNYIFGISIAIGISYILLLKLRIIDTEDMQDILKILPKMIADPVVNIIIKISNKLR